MPVSVGEFPGLLYFFEEQADPTHFEHKRIPDLFAKVHNFKTIPLRSLSQLQLFSGHVHLGLVDLARTKTPPQSHHLHRPSI